MATRAGVGMSRHHNPAVAGREAAEQALEKAGVERPDFVFVFGSLGYDQNSLVRAVREATGGAPLTGCSAEGTIDGEDADESGFSVVVTHLLRRFRQSLDPDAPWVGFYTSGEIGSVEEHNLRHLYTSVVLALS